MSKRFSVGISELNRRNVKQNRMEISAAKRIVFDLFWLGDHAQNN